MWHRCLKCEPKDGVPPATRRIIMSDAAWGLSFGKFLELSFSNHATANRVASCGHSLQRDCLRFYGYVSVIFFPYSYCSVLQWDFNISSQIPGMETWWHSSDILLLIFSQLIFPHQYWISIVAIHRSGWKGWQLRCATLSILWKLCSSFASCTPVLAWRNYNVLMFLFLRYLAKWNPCMWRYPNFFIVLKGTL